MIDLELSKFYLNIRKPNLTCKSKFIQHRPNILKKYCLEIQLWNLQIQLVNRLSYAKPIVRNN